MQEDHYISNKSYSWTCIIFYFKVNFCFLVLKLTQISQYIYSLIKKNKFIQMRIWIKFKKSGRYLFWTIFHVERVLCLNSYFFILICACFHFGACLDHRFVHKYACMFGISHIYIHICTHITCTHTRAHMHTHIHTCSLVRACLVHHTYTYKHTCTHITHTNTHTHTHMHAC